ncbi:RNA polymerase RpoE-like sigma-24 subunit [Gallaecimonas pentaromativorans]|uniref:RNA polymerase sigma factor n=1 Tax=Gallaecimonas pentaromativorans TaxID=584787 RepID=A0A3N1PP15_9GAMM|nr:RNA polymerase RpoE-like sigma-24 subunit [Gallaecimonas pentaromativorans]
MNSRQRRFEALVGALSTDLYRYGLWLTSDPGVADDLVQETFLRAWKYLDDLKDEKSARAWLITILRRENARRFERKQFDMTDYEEAHIADEHSLDSETQLSQLELQRAMGQLAVEYREPLVLQVLFGYSGEEIGQMLELNTNTVMTRLFRARNQLREMLGDTATSNRRASE